ncbi:RcpC/CpaB family pilus assembly protein [Pseudarthrobacter sp. NPDC092424]|uniref:RcpC/CpaB family pilus assembly protein n=1 Tax=Pseudarthrobacter sp. NPDC092424 TaxID=3364415 RepID=UPI00381B50BE
MPAFFLRSRTSPQPSGTSPGNPAALRHGSRRRLPARLTGWVNRNRRLAVALLLCAAAASAVHQLTPAPLDTAAAVAATRDLPAGATMGDADLANVRVPPGTVAEGFFRQRDQAMGRQLAGPLRKGQLLTDAQLVGPGLLAGTPVGSAAVPLRMADPSSVRLVSPGQLVNVVLTGAGGFEETRPPEVLAKGVPVLWTSAQGGEGGQWLGTSETEGLLVVAAGAEQAARLAGASTRGKLFFVLVGQ